MFTEYRPAEGDLATTPEVWAENLKNSRAYSFRTWLSICLDARWRLVRRYIPRGRVLDAGCGFGEWVHHLVRAGYAAEGLDYSTELIRRLRVAYPVQHWTQGDTRRMPYPDSGFDGVISWGVIEHDPDGPEVQLREFRRILKSGARAIVTVPHDSAVMRHASQLQFPNGGKFFQYFFTPGELAERLRACGFRVLEAADLPEVSPALVAPRFYARTMGQHVLIRALGRACRLVPWVRGRNGMIYAVAERV